MASFNGSLRFPYVLFDLGSTLIYFDGDWPAIIAESLVQATQTLRGLGYDLDEQAFPEAYNALIQEYYTMRNDKFVEYTSEYVLRDALARHSYPEPDAKHLRQALKAMYAVSQARWRTESDTLPTLERLRTRGYRMGIVSNAADDADVQVLVDQAQIRPYFDFVLTSAQAGVRKPNPVIFEQALAHWNAQPSQAVMIGDLIPADVAGANRLGIASVWISRRADTPENRAAAEQYPPGAVIQSLSELPDLLQNWPE